MKQLDAGSSAYRALIEKELAARMANKAGKGMPDPKVGPTGVCACGTTNDSDARFCKNCGAKLRAA
jgi:hypothetical protein